VRTSTGALDFEIGTTRVLRRGADKRADLSIGTLRNNLDQEVAVVAAGSRDIVFSSLVTGRVISPIDLTVLSELANADLFVRSMGAEARLSLQAKDVAGLNFLTNASKQFSLNRESGSLNSVVETPCCASTTRLASQKS
jgi:hypothetical protein